MTTAYDRLAYPNLAHKDTHPSRLAGFAAICGRPSPSPDRCRVLEIGCGAGGNLLAMAAGAPDSVFVGFDLAATAIAQAQRLADAAGMTNIRFYVADVCDPRVDGSFDYIIAHGIYAWVPADVRAALMALIGRALAPDGVALVSYNVFPGCRARQALRDVLRGMTEGLSDPAAVKTAAKAALEQLAATSAPHDPFHQAIVDEAKAKLERPFDVLFHDEMGEVWEPQRVSEVVAAARSVGLDYLCDNSQARFIDTFSRTDRFEKGLSFSGGDWVRFEQWLDYHDMRRFRASLFVRSGAPVDRQADPDRLRSLHAVGQLQKVSGGDGREIYRTDTNTEIDLTEPEAIRVFDALLAAQPGSIPLAPYADDPVAAAILYRLFVLNGVALMGAPTPFTVMAGERPLASPLARTFAALGQHQWPTLRQVMVDVEDEAGRAFLLMLDGTRDRATLVGDMAARTGQSEDAVRPAVEGGLRFFGQMGLLMG